LHEIQNSITLGDPGRKMKRKYSTGKKRMKNDVSNDKKFRHHIDTAATGMPMRLL